MNAYDEQAAFESISFPNRLPFPIRLQALNFSVGVRNSHRHANDVSVHNHEPIGLLFIFLRSSFASIALNSTSWQFRHTAL